MWWQRRCQFLRMSALALLRLSCPFVSVGVQDVTAWSTSFARSTVEAWSTQMSPGCNRSNFASAQAELACVHKAEQPSQCCHKQVKHNQRCLTVTIHIGRSRPSFFNDCLVSNTLRHHSQAFASVCTQDTDPPSRSRKASPRVRF